MSLWSESVLLWYWTLTDARTGPGTETASSHLTHSQWPPLARWTDQVPYCAWGARGGHRLPAPAFVGRQHPRSHLSAQAEQGRRNRAHRHHCLCPLSRPSSRDRPRTRERTPLLPTLRLWKKQQRRPRATKRMKATQRQNRKKQRMEGTPELQARTPMTTRCRSGSSTGRARRHLSQPSQPCLVRLPIKKLLAALSFCSAAGTTSTRLNSMARRRHVKHRWRTRPA